MKFFLTKVTLEFPVLAESKDEAEEIAEDNLHRTTVYDMLSCCAREMNTEKDLHAYKGSIAFTRDSFVNEEITEESLNKYNRATSEVKESETKESYQPSFKVTPMGSEVDIKPFCGIWRGRSYYPGYNKLLDSLQIKSGSFIAVSKWMEFPLAKLYSIKVWYDGHYEKELICTTVEVAEIMDKFIESKTEMKHYSSSSKEVVQ